MFWEKINRKSHWITVIVGILIILFSYYELTKPPEGEVNTISYTTDTVKAQILYIEEQGRITLGDITQPYQIARVRILDGEYAGAEFSIDYGKRSILPNAYLLSPGEKILVSVSKMVDGNTTVYFMDYVRTNSLIVLGFLFILVCVLVSGWKGIRSILGIGLSILVIIYFIVPQILDGENPILISLIGSFFFLMVTQYLVFGWTLKTHIALSGFFISIIIIGILTWFFVDYARLNGLGDENAMYLIQQSSHMDIKNLLIAGIIVGALGVLDDLVIGQTSAVIEIYRADPGLNLRQRFMRSMNVGKDHVAATVNTLVMAYLGASLSLFLLFSQSNMGFTTLININYFAEEIVRAMVGTIGLFITVPITTFIACWVVDDSARLEKLVKIFGPLLNQSEVHG